MINKRYKNNNNSLIINHIISNITIKTAINCQNCPLKLYSSNNDKIIFGVGNIITDTILVLPSYNVNSYIGNNTILKIIQDIYKKIKGKDIFEDYYITRSIKCFNTTDFLLEKYAVDCCFNYLLYEINRIKPNKIIILDKYISNKLSFYNFSFHTHIINIINPYVMYYDNDILKQNFMKEFNKAIL